MTTPDFDGTTYDHDRDHDRLTSELATVRDRMLASAWLTLAQISAATGYPEASISARLRDLRKPKFGGFDVQRRHLGNGVWAYHVSRPSAPDQAAARPMAQAPARPTVSPLRPASRWPNWECPVDFTEPETQPELTISGDYARAYCGGCKKFTLFRHRRNP